MAERIVESEVNGNIVWKDGRYDHRWLDAVGPDVVKWIEDFVHLPVDDQTGNPTAYTTTEVGTNTIALVAGAAAGNVLITTGGTENNGLQSQLKGEAFKLEANYPWYIGARFAINDVDQVDAAVGLAITDTTMLDGCTHGAYFRTVDESGTLNFVLEKSSNETLVVGYTLTDNAFVTAEAQYDGDTARIYMNGVEVGSVQDLDANWPSDEYLTPTIAILTGEGTANTLTLEWARVILIRN